MAGVGGSWGSREEMLHPRDKHGRFRKTWKMAENAINAITGFLDKFQPRTFQSDGQAAQYVFNRAKPSRFGGGQGYPRLHADLDETNAHLRAGEIDDSTKKFIRMMDDSAITTNEPLILSRTMNADAFGLTPETLGNEQGGLEDLTGWVIKDPGYSTNVIGTPMGHGPGKVTMTIATPKGTKAIIPARSPNDRAVFLDRDQELAITKVEPDGRGGYYMMAVAVPSTGKAEHEPLQPGPHGAGLTPAQREQRVLDVQRMQAKRQLSTSDQQLHAEAVAQGNQHLLQQQQQPGSFIGNVPDTHGNARPQGAPAPSTPQPAPQAPTPTPQAPGAPAPRNEPVLRESVGGPNLTGRTTSEIAQTLPEGPTPTPAVAPAAPEAPPVPASVNFRQAVRDAQLTSPSEGKRRAQWNNAYLGVASGKKDPGDMLRELERDIDVNNHIQAEHVARATTSSDPHLPDDIKSQEELADLIATTFDLPRNRKAPAAPAPTPEAPRAPEAPASPTPGPKTIPGAPPTTREAPVKERKAAGTAAGKITAGRLEAGDKILVQKQGDNWVPATRKTGASTVTVKTVGRGSAGGRARIGITATDENGNEIQIQGAGFSNARGLPGVTPSQTFHHVQEPSAAPAKKVAKAAVPSAPKKAAPSPTSTEAKAATPGGIEQYFGDRKPTMAELRAFAKENDIAGARSKDELSRKILDAIAERKGRNGSYEPVRPGQRANEAAFMAEADRARELSRKISNLDQTLGNGGSNKAVEHGIKQLEDSGAIPTNITQKMREDLAGGNRNLIQDALGRLEKGNRLTRIGKTGEVVPFNPAVHEPANTEQVRPGEFVRVIRPGHHLEGGPQGTALLRRAPVVAEGPSAPRIKEAEKLTGNPRSGVPMAGNKGRQETFKEAWDSAGIKVPGSAGRSTQEVVDDVHAGKLTPAQGIERVENDIKIDTADLADVRKSLRGELSKGERTQLQADEKKLTDRIDAQTKASDWMRGYFKNEPAVTQKEIQVQLPADAKKALDEATPETLKQAAQQLGMPTPEGNTKDEVVQSILKNMAKARLDEINAKKATKAVKTPPPKIPAEPQKIDAHLLGEAAGADITNPWIKSTLDDVQRALDGDAVPGFVPKNSTPAAIGRALEKQMEHFRGSVAISNLDTGLAGPEFRRKQDEMRQAAYARADRLDEVAKKLKGMRRPRVSKATGPSIPAPEAKAIKARDELQARVSTNFLDDARNAKNHEGAIKALDKATMPDLRAIAGPMGIKGRSKDDLKQKIAEALHGNKIRPEPSLAEMAKELGIPGDAGGVIPARQLDLKQGLNPQEVADRILQDADRLEASPMPAPGSDKIITQAMQKQRDDSVENLRRLATRLRTHNAPAAQKPALNKTVPAPVSASGPLQRHRPSFENGSNTLQDRPNADEPIKMPRMAMTGAGTMHADSAMGQLWNDLYRDDRVPNSDLNRIMELGVSMAHGDRPFDDIMKDLHRMAANEPDPAVAARIQRAFDAIDSPGARVPRLPDTVPAEVKSALDKLSKIPTARKLEPGGGRRLSKSILDEKIDIVKKIDSGEIGPFDLRDTLGKHDLHESTDGAVQMWKITDALTNDKAVTDWARAARIRRNNAEKNGPGNVTQLPTREPGAHPSPAKAAPSSGATVTQLPVAKGGKLPPGLQDVVSKLRAANNEADARSALNGLLGVELKRILATLGLSDAGSKADWINTLIKFATR